MGRHLQTKAGSQHRCLCRPPVHRFSGTLQVPAKAWHGERSGKPPGLPCTPRMIFHQGKDLRTPTGAGGRGPEPLPHSSPSPVPTGSRPSSSGEQHRVECRAGVQTPVAGGGERQPPSKPPPGLTHPISPRNRALRAHSQPLDQECREEVWQCGGVGLMVTKAI